MKIKTLVEKLTYELQVKFKKFCTLVDEFKKLEEQQVTDKQLKKHFDKMSKVAFELEPALFLLEIEPSEMLNVLQKCLDLNKYKNADNTQKAYYDGQRMLFDPQSNPEEN